MNLSISNIGWEKENDEYMYCILQKSRFSGIEIAPTRIFPISPYENISKAYEYRELLHGYQLEISSIQSIWFGKTENIFSSTHELQELKEYTKKAILFAEALGCKNLVFGCPKNRARNKNSQNTLADIKEFLKCLGDFAYKHNTCFSLEPNPVIYGTNFINKTTDAFELVKEINCPGFKVNLDFGTIIENNESLEDLDYKWINHIHLTEPGLETIKERSLHKKLIEQVIQNNYMGYISIEMKKNSISTINTVIHYLEKLSFSEKEEKDLEIL